VIAQSAIVSDARMLPNTALQIGKVRRLHRE
jgi:hypothetical protein